MTYWMIIEKQVDFMWNDPCRFHVEWPFCILLFTVSNLIISGILWYICLLPGEHPTVRCTASVLRDLWYWFADSMDEEKRNAHFVFSIYSRNQYAWMKLTTLECFRLSVLKSLWDVPKAPEQAASTVEHRDYFIEDCVTGQKSRTVFGSDALRLRDPSSQRDLFSGWALQSSRGLGYFWSGL